MVVALDVPAGTRLPVGEVFAEGQALRDAYSGQSLRVSQGQVSLAAGRVVLIEIDPKAGAQ